VDSLPPATDGKTLIPPPDPQTAAMLQDIAGRGDWGALVQAAETQLSLYIFWLDLNRYSGVALERLGPPYRAAADAVCLETAGLLQRLPGLEKLTFADGTPLADQQTLDWLQTIFPGAAGATDISLADAGSQGPADDRFTEIFDQARNLVEENKLVKAVALLQEEMQHSFSACDRLRWRLALVWILITSKNSGLAMPHFDQLVHDIDTYRLESWDPDLALTCFKVILAGLKTLRDKTAQQMGETILHRIARLDPLEALRQGKG
jgi:type VI secretion system protein VasJ